ncbi:oxidoreductase family protein isoform X2 [Wolffia australiana]
MGGEEGEMGVIRYGIVGVGMMGREHMVNISHIPAGKAMVAAVADPHPPSLHAALDLADSFGWPLKVFSGHKGLLDSGLCDVVVVSSPNMTHFGILMDVFRHPRPHHVLVEKPLCTTVDHCKQVMAAAEGRPEIVVHVGLEYRFMPPVAKLLEIAASRELGSIKMVAIREHRFPFLVKVPTQSGSWPRAPLASTTRTKSTTARQVPDIIDNAFVIVEFENGVRGMLDLCMFAEGSKNEQEISVVGDTGKGEALVPEGIVRMGTRQGGRNCVQTMKPTDDRIRYEGLHHGSSYLEHLAFLAAVKAAAGGGAVPTVDLRAGLLSVAVGVAGQLSIELGRFVSIEEVLE